MKRNKYHILFARLLLFVFVAGQVVLFGHQHNVNSILSKVHSRTSQSTIAEKCQLCDAMHFNYMALTSLVYAPAEQARYDLFTPRCYDFVSISLILSGGRAPPISNFSV